MLISAEVEPGAACANQGLSWGCHEAGAGRRQAFPATDTIDASLPYCGNGGGAGNGVAPAGGLQTGPEAAPPAPKPCLAVASVAHRSGSGRALHAWSSRPQRRKGGRIGLQSTRSSIPGGRRHLPPTMVSMQARGSHGGGTQV